MKSKARQLNFLLTGLVLGIAGGVVAQPDTRNAPKGANPPTLPQMGNWQNMTPAQRQEAMKKMVDQTMRDSLNRIGVTDEKTQTTIVQFAEAQEKSKQRVRQKARKVSLGLLDNALSDAQITVLMNELRQAVEEARTEQEEDVATLEKLTDLSQKPKLKAFLTMMGLIGEETLFLHGVFGNYMNAISILMEPPAAPENPQPKQ
jgi:hypothetical protein